jgi:hypothetical protein
MKFPRTKIAAFGLAALPLFGVAQTNTPIVLPELPAASAPSKSASGVPTPPPGPRQRSAAETGGRATAPGDLKPERPVAPQISIPIGKKAPPPTAREEGVVQRGGAASAGGVDDAAARCEAQIDAQLRSDCRAKLVHQEPPRAPS